MRWYLSHRYGALNVVQHGDRFGTDVGSRVRRVMVVWFERSDYRCSDTACGRRRAFPCNKRYHWFGVHHMWKMASDFLRVKWLWRAVLLPVLSAKDSKPAVNFGWATQQLFANDCPPSLCQLARKREWRSLDETGRSPAIPWTNRARVVSITTWGKQPLSVLKVSAVPLNPLGSECPCRDGRKPGA